MFRFVNGVCVMANIYADLQKVASDVIGEFKQGEMVYIGLTAGTGGTIDNPAEPVETETAFNGVARGAQFKYVDNSKIFASDLQITMPADGVTPTLAGFIEIDGTRYKIVGVDAIPPAGTPVAYRVFVRR